jgi:hypothetical protein
MILLQVVIIVMMMANKQNSIIDWDALDVYWTEMYEEDYGHFFYNSHVLLDSTETRVLTAVEA